MINHKAIMSLALTTAVLGGLAVNTGTSVQAATNSVVTTSSDKDPQTLILTADGTLEGQLVPHIADVPNTGVVTLHYSAKNTGFVDGDVSKLLVSLPEEFKYLAVQPDFAKHVTGEVRQTSFMGEPATPISPKNTHSYSDRLVIDVPSSFWIGVGDVEADIVIHFGDYLEQNPKYPVPDAPLGYKFVTQLKYSSAPWDFIKDPIIGTDTDTIYTDETQAVIN